MRRRVLRFASVGVVGFVVDAGLLVVLAAGGANVYGARLVSFPVAVTLTWYLNRAWSFDVYATDRPLREYLSYFSVQVVAALANFVIYAMLLRFVLGERLQMAFAALAVGAIAGMVINYLGSRRIVFVNLASPSSTRENGFEPNE